MSASLCTQVCGWSKPNTELLIADVMRILLSTVLFIFRSSKFKSNVWKFKMQHDKSKQKKKLLNSKRDHWKCTPCGVWEIITQIRNAININLIAGPATYLNVCRAVSSSFLFLIVIIIFFYRFCNWHQIGARISLSAGYLFHRMLSINIIITMSRLAVQQRSQTKKNKIKNKIRVGNTMDGWLKRIAKWIISTRFAEEKKNAEEK